jgi:RNA polymerase sigma-70 factor (ECF subfamily)
MGNIESIQSFALSEEPDQASDTEPRIRVEWVLKFQQGDMAAFETIFAFERKRLSRYIFNFVRLQDVVEDIFQEVWIEAWQHRADLRKPESFLSWLYGITRQRIALYYRKNHQRVRIQLFGDTSVSNEVENTMEDKRPGPDHSIRKTQWQEVFDQEVNNLDLVCQEIISYRFGAGMSLREIAERLDRQHEVAAFFDQDPQKSR